MHHGGHDRIWPTLRAMHDFILIAARCNLNWNSIRARLESHRKTALLNLHLLPVVKTMRIAPPFELPAGGFRWWYRQALWREPRLGYVDPVYTLARTVLSKILVSKRLLKNPVGRRYVLSTPFRQASINGCSATSSKADLTSGVLMRGASERYRTFVLARRSPRKLQSDCEGRRKPIGPSLRPGFGMNRV